jgi:magnesium-transporting ATPase (P-type)
VAWALTGGAFPLAIGVMQVLALDIGTDLLPALALGAEPPSSRVLSRGARTGQLLDRGVLVRAFGVLGPMEVLASLGAFAVVLVVGDWSWGLTPSAGLLTVASGTAFAAIVLGQLGNAFACRSSMRPAYRIDPRRNPLLLAAVAVELGVLVLFLGLAPLARILGGGWPNGLGWALAALAVPAVIFADAGYKALVRRSLPVADEVARRGDRIRHPS